MTLPDMAISRVKTWTTNEDLTSSDLNSEFNQVMNNAANTGSAETISARYTFSAGVILDELVATNAAGAGNIKISEFRWDPASGTAADGDGMYIDWVADDAGGTETIMARTGVELTDTDATGEDSEFEIHTMIAATLTKVASFGAAGTTFNTAVTVGVDDTGKDVKFFGATSGQYMLWDESADELVLAGDSKLSFHDAAGGENIIASADGHLEINAGTTLDITATTIDLNGAVAMNGATTGGTNITISGELDAATLDISGNADIDGTTNLDAVDIDGAVQIDATVSVGVDDQGYDVKFFGDTASAYLLWDTSADKLLTAGGATIDIVKDKLLIGGTAVTTTAAELNVLDAVTAGTVAASKAVVVDSNKDAASFRNITLTGELDAATLDISGNADIDGTLEADAYTVDGTALNEYIADTVGAMVTSNTETNIAVTYQDGDNTLDFAISSIDGTTVGASSASTGAFTTLSATGNVSFDGGTFVFNEAGADKDFRIEGDSNQNLFFADASTDRVGIGTASPGADLEVSSAMGTLRLASTDGAVDDDQIISKIEFWTTDNQFTGSGEGIAAQISAISEHSTGDDYGLQFMTGTDATATEKVRITNVGRVGIGTSDPDTLMHLEAANAGPTLKIEDTGNNTATIRLDGDRSSENQEAGKIFFDWNGNNIAKVTGLAGPDTTNKDDGKLAFETAAPGGTMTRAMTIDENQVVDIGGSFECNKDGVVKWGSSKDYGLLTWDTGKAIVGGQSGKALEFQAGGSLAATIDTGGEFIINGTSGTGPLTVWANSGASCTRLVGRNNGTTDEAELLFTHNDESTAHGNITGKSTGLYFAGGTTAAMNLASDGGVFFSNLLAASASTDVNINGSNELHSVTSSGVYKEDYSVGIGSDRVLDLQPRAFTWRHPIDAPDGWAQQVGDPGRRDFGLIAEEVAEVMPELVNYKDGQPYSVRYQMMSVLLLEQLQELKQEIEDLKNAA